MVYNLYFHPLASFPGPWLARSSLLWRVWHTTSGRIHLAVDEQHKRYGDVVRVAPNELSFCSVESWKGIYGHASAQRTKPMVKSEFYDMYGSGYRSLCIGSERDPARHRRMKQTLTAAFSTKALLEQESIVRGCVDQFVTAVGRASDASPAGNGVDVTKWYEMLAFDILGEMAFGESFNCISDGKPHFWQQLILEHIFFVTVLDNLRRYPVVARIGKLLLPRFTVSIRDKHSGYSRDKVARRLAADSGRKDFLTNLVAKVQAGELDREELTAHSSTLVIAGGETVATFLAAVTYFLLRNPSAYAKLRDEIRTRYASADDIDARTAQLLPYLQAVIAEGLRMYPPGSQGFPRISPGAVVDGVWVPPGAECYTSAWSPTHDERYFHQPYAFKPERWLDPDCADVKEASQPFSLGPRGCLGRNFAYVEMSLTLATLHYKYDLELVDDKLDWLESSKVHIMWWKPELRVRFKQRK
ncbi:cytochrome P450 monooxygenase [Macrophomina phaseolina]|uniref:Cytochrome P450 monooxygenase n=1 Tax=Macrophomina phaseolina TaxID=35725 RepID=A0ABQ8FY28_9PEZI|nr:cytochrome P450 monooxygenase [Macrophomina phaseolina]